MKLIIWLLLIAGLVVLLAKVRASFKAWSIGIAIALLLMKLVGFLGWPSFVLLSVVFAVIALPLNLTGVRRRFLSKPMLAQVKRILPPMSDTERTAIEAGTVWWEAELFSGRPRWEKLLQTPIPHLTDQERAFLDGPVEELCAMLDDWRIGEELHDLPPEVWDFIKKNRFFGMIIPERFNGLGFSAYAHSEVVLKIATRSVDAAVTVMVPNSLGPAELLLHYGTEDQKNHYLPRLALGEEIPCFGLTSPSAGSDASSIPDAGYVCQAEFEGKQVLGLRTSWEKRYITLGPVATVLGLAFKAFDPDGLLGEQADLGITCALIPVNTPGVDIGRRHNPMSGAFMNGPNSGKDVFIPMDWVIGGQAGVGNGWRMLMESLSAGRGISLPSLGTAAGKFAARQTGNYARVRKQFRLPIGKFEGVEEALARIGGITYMMDAARVLTTAALDMGEKPSVVSAILKYHNTEGMRQVVNDAMDVHGGRGICKGPSNYLARVYQAIPVGITVEGANILTRSMIIFGQGAMRCHPYLLAELQAAADDDAARALEKFDDALFRHIGLTTKNSARSLVFGLTRGALAPSPVSGPTAKYWRRLARMSAAYALISDVTLLFLGGALKRKEKLSGRFADALIYMFICSAVLKRWEDHGRPQDDLPLVEWSAMYSLFQVQNALDEILRHFPSFIIGQILRFIVLPLGRGYRHPNDELGHKVASLLLEPSDTRDRLTSGCYISPDVNDVTGRMEHAFKVVLEAEAIEKQVRKMGARRPDTMDYEVWLQGLVAQQTINQAEAEQLRAAYIATRVAIMVDDFETIGNAASSKKKTTARKKRSVRKKPDAAQA